MNQHQGFVHGLIFKVIKQYFEKKFSSLNNYLFVKELDQFDWEDGTGRTALAGTGPQTDHTFGNPEGHYLYIGKKHKKQIKNLNSIIIFDL